MSMTKQMIAWFDFQYFVAKRHVAPMSIAAFVKYHCWRFVGNKYIHIIRYQAFGMIVA